MPAKCFNTTTKIAPYADMRASNKLHAYILDTYHSHILYNGKGSQSHSPGQKSSLH